MKLEKDLQHEVERSLCSSCYYKIDDFQSAVYSGPTPTHDGYAWVTMNQQNASVVPLHHDWKYLDASCNLLNEEWPRSMTARMHSLEASCDNFPTSLILLVLEPDTNEELLIGHSKISPMHSYPSACFIESVVVARKFRNKGWGRYIMLETEKYVQQKSKSVIFLTTSDKEEFYSKLGYNKCEPVSIYGCKKYQIKNVNIFNAVSTKLTNLNGILERPPPPPPLPASLKAPVITKVYMMKVLT